MRTNILTLTMAACAALPALVGCGESAPSDKDVQAAMARQIDQTMGKGASESQREELAKIKVAKCAKAELGGFSCEFETPMGGKATGRFVKEEGGWIMAGTGG